jgi:hypothetical protein
MSDAPRGHWIAGRRIDGAGENHGWSWVLGVAVLVLAIDVVLALTPRPPARAPIDDVLEQAVADAENGRSLLVIGAIADLDTLERELGRDAEVRITKIPAATPAEMLALVEALDERDVEGAVEVVVVLDVTAIGPAHASASAGPIRETLTSWLREHTPVLRHRDPVEPLAALLHRREPAASPTMELSPVERLRGATLDVAALERLIARLIARERKATFVLPPLPDRVAYEAELDVAALAVELAGRIHAHESDALALISLDHPLFVDAHFDEQLGLDDEGRRLLARNLLHQLELPLATRPEEWSMIHPEGHDQTLVHGVVRGAAIGPAWSARFDRPEAIATDDEGRTIVIADTGNHVLRVLRGNHQFVEPLAGAVGRPGHREGPGALARVESPRTMVVIDDRAVFVDGSQREHLRSVELDPSHEGLVRTLDWSGPRCAAIDGLRRDRTRDRLILLCDDDRTLALMLGPDPHAVQLAPAAPEVDRVAVEISADHLFWADSEARLWLAKLDRKGRPGPPVLRFANTSQVTLPNDYMAIFPFGFDQVGLEQIVGMQWIDRYDSLLVVDVREAKRRNEGLTERVHLRLFDFESEQILPWIKPIPHGDAFFNLNATNKTLSSWYHLGSFALVERDASLLWLERERSRLLRIADGLLGVAQAGYLHTSATMTDRLMPLCSRSSQVVLADYRPDRFLDRRHEPLARRGPFVALLISSSMSTMSDRFDNYDMARLFEYELQRELGYRDGIRLDLFHRTWPVASFADEVGKLDEFMTSALPPDVILLEVHSFIGAYLKHSKEPGQLRSQLAQLTALAERYDSLVVFYDNSAIASHQRDGFRGTSAKVASFLADARALGFVVLEPSDRLLRELLVESPWGNQPWSKNSHHGSTWAVELTAQALAQMAYPSIREFLRDRRPARLDERDPAEFEDPDFHPLREAWEAAPIDPQRREQLPKLHRDHMQIHYADRHVRVFIDLAGHEGLERDEANMRALALAVVAAQVGEDVHGDLADRITIELVEFSNYDEYGAGVLESANRVWQRSMTTAELEAFLRE